MKPFDSDPDSSASDPLVDALRGLQPTRCEVDTAELFYRSGYAAAVAQRRSRTMPSLTLAASLLLVATLSGLAGYSVGDVTSTAPLAVERVVTTSPPPLDAPQGSQAIGAEGASTDPGSNELEPVAAPETPPGPTDHAPLQPAAFALDHAFPAWSRWFDWQLLDPSATAAPNSQLTIRPTHDQWQQLVHLRMPPMSHSRPAIGGDPDRQVQPMLSSMATEAALRSLVQ